MSALPFIREGAREKREEGEGIIIYERTSCSSNIKALARIVCSPKVTVFVEFSFEGFKWVYSMSFDMNWPQT